MMTVYIAGPFRGPNRWTVKRNVQVAREWALRVAEAGHVPVCPHAMYEDFDGLLTDRFWLDATMELMRRCDAVVMIPGWEDSAGARGELKEALSLGMPCWEQRDGLPSLGEWLATVSAMEHT